MTIIESRGDQDRRAEYRHVYALQGACEQSWLGVVSRTQAVGGVRISRGAKLHAHGPRVLSYAVTGARLGYPWSRRWNATKTGELGGLTFK